MSDVVPPDSADEALQMLRSAMAYLAEADATAMTAEEQARCLRVMEQATSVGTAARTSVLSAFTSGQGYSADADYSPRAWLIHKTGVTKGAAVAYTAWVRRAEDHPRMLAAMATGDLPESVARVLCQLVAANVLPDRAGQPVKIWAHISLADLLRLEGSSALLEEWTALVRAGGPGTGPPRPKAAGTAASGWTATPPRRSPATRLWPPSSPVTSTPVSWMTWSGCA
jgi:hypothetical protein